MFVICTRIRNVVFAQVLNGSRRLYISAEIMRGLGCATPHIWALGEVIGWAGEEPVLIVADCHVCLDKIWDVIGGEDVF